MEDVVRLFDRTRRLWEQGKLLKLDWDDLEWDLQQLGKEYAGMLTHLRHLHEELDARPDEDDVADLERRLETVREVAELEKKRLRLEVDEARATVERFRRGQEEIRRELECVRQELAHAREEAELLSRGRSDVPLFHEEEEGTD